MKLGKTSWAPSRRTPRPSVPEEPGGIETVLLVHGTFANSGAAGDVDWWLPGSAFCAELDAALAQSGSKARCWSHSSLKANSTLAREAYTAPFAWTGANSERDRRAAGRALAAELQALEADPAIARYHLIAHSHGGNVLLHALRTTTEAPRKLGGVAFLGTPVLSFRHRATVDLRWISIPLYIAVAIALLLDWPVASGNTFTTWVVALAVLFAFLADLVRPPTRRALSDAQIYGSGRAIAFAFPCDEAIEALLRAEEIAGRPVEFIKQFMSTSGPETYAVAPVPAPRATFGKMIEETGAYAALQWLQTVASPPAAVELRTWGRPVPSGANAPAYALPSTVSQLARRSVFVDRVLALVASSPVNAALLAILLVLAIAPVAVMLVVGASIRVLAWFSNFLKMLVLGLSALLFARLGLPFIMRKAALGADEGRFLRVTRCPPGVVECENLSEDLQAEAAAIAARVGSSAGTGIVGAITRRDAFAIKSFVEEALTNTALAHSHYYHAPEVRERIVRLIATCP